MRVSGVPFDQGRNAAGVLNPTACVLHRTFGQWPGDYAVGKNGRADSPGIGFQFLVGKAEGQWCQFYDTGVKTGHAKGANSWAFGIEITGTNDDVLTDWQIRAVAHILAVTLPFHRIPATYVDGSAGRARVNGCLAHRAVPGSDHTDFITMADWNRVIGAIGTPVHAQQDTPPAQFPTNPATKDIDAMASYVVHPNKVTVARVTGDRFHVLPNGDVWNINKLLDGIQGAHTDPVQLSQKQWDDLQAGRTVIS